MTAQIIPLTVSDLNTAINHEPRVRDLAIAERLGFDDKHKIRELIQRNRAELESYGEISATVAENTDPHGRGRPGTEYWLNEAQALLLCTFSRTAQAAEVRRSLITVFMDWRRGQQERVITVKEHKRKLARDKAETKPALAPLPAPRPALPSRAINYAEVTEATAKLCVGITRVKALCEELETQLFFPNRITKRSGE